MTPLSFSVLVKAEPQGSMSAFIIEGQVDVNDPCSSAGKPNWVRKPRAIITSDNPDLKAYRRAVECAARKAMRGTQEPLAAKHVPVRLELGFTFIMPQSVRRRTEMVVRPDVDKCLRSTLDALTGVIYFDDSQVVEISTRKQYGPSERVDVSVQILAPTTGSLALTEDF